MQKLTAGRLCVNGELEKMWKKVAVLYFRVLPQHLPGEPVDSHKILSHDR
jgi:hypothetical protein